MSPYVVSGYWVDGYAEGDASSTTYLIAAANSTQANTASTASISQTHLIVGAAVSVDNVASASAIVQAHLIGAANAVQGNFATAGSVGDVPDYAASIYTAAFPLPRYTAVLQ